MSYKNIENNQLCQLYKDGDEKAFTELYNRFNPIVSSRLNRLVVHDKEEIDDIAQEIWMTASRYLKSSFEGKADFGTYLYTIIRTRFMNHFRRKRGQGLSQEDQEVFESYLYAESDVDSEGSRQKGHRVALHKQLTDLIDTDGDYLHDCFEAYGVIEKDVLKNYNEDQIKCYMYKGCEGMTQASKETGFSYWTTKDITNEIESKITERFEDYVKNYY